MQDKICDYKKQNSQILICHLLCILVCYAPFLNLTNSLINQFVSSRFIWDTAFIYGIIVAMIIISSLFTLKYFKMDVFLLVTFFILGYLITYVVFPNNIIARQSGVSSILSCILGNITIYYFGRYVTDYSRLYKMFVKYSYILIIISICNYFVSGINSHVGGYMPFSYNMLPGVLILMFEFIRNKNIFAGLTSALGILFVIIAGARGPIICILIAIILFLLLNEFPVGKKIALIVLFSSISIMIMFFFKDIINVLVEISDSLGINSRTLNRLLEGSIADDNGRIMIQEVIVSDFSVFPHGLWGEWVLINSYPHNIFIEIIYQYGLFLGPIILLLLIFFMGQGLCAKNYDLKLLIIVMFACSFMRMQLSGSYLNKEPAFYLMLALCSNAIMERKFFCSKQFCINSDKVNYLSDSNKVL